jgi:glycosyltransferase involved in cell wall biosynthesis
VFAGPRSDVGDWLAAADVVAIPSRAEAMSLVLLEAMARGRSVVASDVSGAREALGDAGAVVPSEAVAPLAAALSERLLDPQRAAGEGALARSRAERYFDIRRTSALIADVYENVIAGRSAATA